MREFDDCIETVALDTSLVHEAEFAPEVRGTDVEELAGHKGSSTCRAPSPHRGRVHRFVRWLAASAACLACIMVVRQWKGQSAPSWPSNMDGMDSGNIAVVRHEVANPGRVTGEVVDEKRLVHEVGREALANLDKPKAPAEPRYAAKVKEKAKEKAKAAPSKEPILPEKGTGKGKAKAKAKAPLKEPVLTNIGKEKAYNEVFVRIDRNGDGFISAAELRQYGRTTTEVAGEMFRDADMNGDGRVTQTEYLEMLI